MAGAWWGTDGGGSDAGSGGDCVGDESGGGSPQPHSNGDRQHEMLEDILMTCGLTDTPALFSPTTGDDYLRTLEAFGLADLGSNETFGSGQRTEDNIIIDAFQEASHDGGISQNMSSSIHQGTPDDRRSSFTSSMAPSTPLIQETSPTVLPFTTDPLLSLSSPSPNAFTPTANTAGIPHPRHPPSGDSFASTRMRNVSAPSAMLPINSTPLHMIPPTSTIPIIPVDPITGIPIHPVAIPYIPRQPPPPQQQQGYMRNAIPFYMPTTSLVASDPALNRSDEYMDRPRHDSKLTATLSMETLPSPPSAIQMQGMPRPPPPPYHSQVRPTSHQPLRPSHPSIRPHSIRPSSTSPTSTTPLYPPPQLDLSNTFSQAAITSFHPSTAIYPYPDYTKDTDIPSMPPIDTVTSVYGGSATSVTSGVVTQKRGRSGDEKSDEDVGEDMMVKRRRNTEAARRSRQKKMLKLTDLENFAKRLETQNSKLTVKVAVLENEKVSLLTRQRDLMARIGELERQLEEAHKGLVTLNSAMAAVGVKLGKEGD